MKRISLFGAAALVLALVSVPGAWAFGTKDVVAMHREGIADSLIIEKIEHSGAVFHLGSKDLSRLQQEGVSDRVVGAMLRTENRRDTWYGYDPWGGPHAYLGFDYLYGPPFWPGYGYWPYPSVTFGYRRFAGPGFRPYGYGFRRR